MDDPTLLDDVIENASVFLDDATILCTMLGDETQNLRTAKWTQTLGPLFREFKDNLDSACQRLEENDFVSLTLSASEKHPSCRCASIRSTANISLIAERNKSIFAWASPSGTLEGFSIDRRKSLHDEGCLYRWLHERKNTVERGGSLLICSGGGVGGFSDAIVMFLKHAFDLPNFENLLGNEAYIGISTCDSNLKFNGLEEVRPSGFEKTITKTRV